LRAWLAEKDWQLWDKQIESADGKLDFLLNEAPEAKTRSEDQRTDYLTLTPPLNAFWGRG